MIHRKQRLCSVAAVVLGALALAPGAAQAVAPTCADMSVGVPHNASMPIFVECTGGTGAGSPDVLVTSNPTKGILSTVAGQTSTDQWIVYTPAAGQAGADSFKYRGVSPGSGSGGSDEMSGERTVNLRIATGTPPVCASLSQSVPQNTATHLRLVCASGGDPITSFAISDQPDHGSLTTTSLNSGLVGYTSTSGYAGADAFSYRATSTCGAPSCLSNPATFDLTVLSPQQGPTGPPGPPGPVGPAGPKGADGGTIISSRLLIASFLDGLTVRRGGSVVLRYVATMDAQATLEVFRGSRRVASVRGRARAGRNAIRWNGKVAGRPAAVGLYRLGLRATAGDQVVSDRASVRVLARKRRG